MKKKKKKKIRSAEERAADEARTAGQVGRMRELLVKRTGVPDEDLDDYFRAREAALLKKLGAAAP